MNYIGQHPLNLIGKVAIVTSASSAQGASISRALLNSNAFILGIDRDLPHTSNAITNASHFKFLKLDLGVSSSEEVGDKVAIALNRHFQKNTADFLVNVVEEGGNGVESLEKLRVVLESMARGKEGLVLNIGAAEGGDEVLNRALIGGLGEAELITTAKLAASKAHLSGVRWNVLLPYNIISDSNHRFILDLAQRDALQSHMNEFEAMREPGRHSGDREREVANLALFFCTHAGSAVNGALVGLDGTCVSL